MDPIEIDYSELQALQQKLLETASKLSEVANGAYLSGDVFPESTGDTAAAMNDLLNVLAKSATVLFALLLEAARYFELVIKGFQDWDKQQANSFIDAFNTFMINSSNSPTAPVNQPPRNDP